MKLYYAPGACSLASHIVLREAEREFDLERVDLATHRTARGIGFERINPKRDVPVLELDGFGSEVLTESPAILQYVGDLVPDRRLVPPSGTFARYHLQEWLSFVASELHSPIAALRGADVPSGYAGRLRGRVADRFGYLQNVLDDRAHLMGETFTVADAYLFVMLWWCPDVGIDTQLWPNLRDYELRIARRPSVQAAVAAEGVADPHHYRRSA
jgi:glutathione S-transferase